MKKSITILLAIALMFAITIPALATTFDPNSLPTDRRLTDEEFTAWVENYWSTGGPTQNELDIIAEINRVRVEHGVGVLEIDYVFMLCGRFHAQMLVNYRAGGSETSHTFGPYGGHSGVTTAFDALGARGGIWSTGNNAFGSNSAVNSWLNSPGHRRSMLDPSFQSIGLGSVPGGGTYVFLSHQTNPVNPYVTMSASAWARPAITDAISANLVPSHLQNNYRATLNRAEFAALAVSFYETFTGTEITERRTFTDTDDINVQKIAGIGVVSGVGNNRFDPNGTLTREQAATMLSRLANAINRPFANAAPTFVDNARIASWAFDAVGQMQASGIMSGVGGNRFDPQGNYSREQGIITILRLYEHFNSTCQVCPVR